jgi:hypothetical protein
MAQMAVWVFGTTFALTLMVVTVAVDGRWSQFALSSSVALAIGVSAVRHFVICRAAGAHPAIQGVVMTRYMGLLWAWATVSLVLLYVCLFDIGVMVGSLLTMTFAAALCLLIVATVLERDATDTEIDSRALIFIRLVARLQLVATCIAIGGLIAVGKLSAGVAQGGDITWAAVNILLSTAIALAALSAVYLAYADADLAGVGPGATTASVMPEPRIPVQRTVAAAFAKRPIRKAPAGRLRTA